jgi:pyrroline-5-carboxylate reductase
MSGENMKIGVIGFGHLGKALVKGLLLKNIVSKSEIFILAKSERTEKIAENEFGVQVCKDINDTISKVDILFWVLKDNAFSEVCKDIQLDVSKKINVSLMAGIKIKSMQERLGDIFINRAMPSIAIDKANGVIGYTKTNDIFVEEIFKKLGYAFEIEENDIEKVTAFSACGLGFAAYILAAFQNAGQTLGFSPETSEKIIAMTFEAAVNIGNYEEAASAVATKGGATEQGILYFEDNDLKRIILEAVNKAYIKMK